MMLTPEETITAEQFEQLLGAIDAFHLQISKSNTILSSVISHHDGWIRYLVYSSVFLFILNIVLITILATKGVI